jgi:hypothetical protein
MGRVMSLETWPIRANRMDVTVMNPVWLSALCVGGGLALSVPSGCVMPTSSDDAGAKVTIPLVAQDSGAIGSKVTGTGCGTDPTTGVTLCVGTSACPNVSVDPSVYPDCGFYITGSSTYLVCLCSGYLCPIGLPTSCDEASTLLQASNEGSVCGEASDNECTAVSSGTGSTGGTGSSGGSEAGSGSDGASGGCDQTCESMCAGEPDCIQLCGC